MQGRLAVRPCDAQETNGNRNEGLVRLGWHPVVSVYVAWIVTKHCGENMEAQWNE